MELDALIAALGRGRAYGTDAPVEVIQTHISVVFLVGDEVFKIHKPVDFGFLDFRQLDARRRDCEAEVEVNRELAPGVYRGVVAVVRRGDQVAIARELEPSDEPSDEVVEWAVWMRRLPDSATFHSLLERGALDSAALERLAETLAEFYQAGSAHAAAHPQQQRLGDLATVRANAVENFTQLDALAAAVTSAGAEPPIDPSLLARLREHTEAELARLGPRIHARWEAGAIRDTHGDLRLDHVYALDRVDPSEATRAGPELLAATGGRSLLIIDRIEFTDRFRWADPIADVAFLLMDLEARGAWSLAAEFAAAFFAASGLDRDRAEATALLRFYAGYRATVRAKIAAMTAAEPEVSSEARAAARTKAAARTRLALASLAPPSQRPCLVLVAGLPGTGKSALARALVDAAGFTWVRSDALRKRLAGLDPWTSRAAGVGEGLYTPEWTERTYAACLDRAGEVCRAGGRAVVDATFVDHRRRETFVAAAIEWGVPTLLLVATAPAELVRDRIEARTRDPSDATWAVYEAASARWRPADPQLCRVAEIDTRGSLDESAAQVLQALADAGLGQPS